MVQITDELGITAAENSAIAALSAGASQEDVDKLSQGAASVTLIPGEQFEPSEFEKETPSDKFEDGVSEFDSAYNYRPQEKGIAARKAMYTALASGKPNQYESMYDQLASTGYSADFDILKEYASKENVKALKEINDRDAAAGDVDALERLYKVAPLVLGNKGNPTIPALQKTAESFTEATERSRDHTRNFLSNIHVWAPTRDKIINEVIFPAIATSDPSLSNYATDVVDMAIFGEQPLALAKVGRDILGERYNFLGGSMFRDLAQYVRSQTTPEAQLEAAKKVVDSIIRHAGTTKDNDFVKTYALDTFKLMLESPGGENKFMLYMTNIFGVVDVASFVPTAMLVKGSKSVKNFINMLGNKQATSAYDRVKGELSDLNPDLDALLGSKSIEDPDVAAKYGTTSERELLRVMPKSHFDEEAMLDGAPNRTLEMYNNTKSKAQEAVEHIDNTFQYADTEFKAKQKRILDTLHDEKVTAIVRKADTEIVKRNLDRNTVSIRVSYGDETDLPLSIPKATQLKQNLDEALKNESLESTSELFVKNKHTGLWEKFDPENHMISTKKVEPMTITDRKGNLIPNPLKRQTREGPKILSPDFLGAKVVLNTEAKMTNTDILPGEVLGRGATKGFGMGSRWYINPQGWIDQRIMGAFRIATDEKGLVKSELFELIKPFTTLSYWNKKKVAGILEAGDELETVFTYKELKEAGYSAKVVEAYYSTRILEDAMYRIKNFNMREKLTREGFQSVNVPNQKGLFQNAGREIESLPSGVSKIFDPVIGKSINVTDKFLNTLQTKGLKLVRALKTVDTEEGRFNYMVVRGDHLSELPTNVYPYRKGHMFRINKDPYFIDEWKFGMEDGMPKEYKRTIGVESNRYRADKATKKLSDDALKRVKEGESPKERYRVRLDRNISMERSVLENELDMLDGGNEFWFSKRGERLRRLTDDSLSAVEDPLTALDRATSSVSNVVTHGKLIDTEAERHRLTYGHLRGNNDRKLWYWDQSEGQYKFDKTAADGFNDKAVKAALHEYEYLEQMKYMPTKLDTKWKQLMAEFDSALGQSDWLSSASKKVFLDTFGATTPGRAARGFAFSTTIPLRPFRHIVLQSATSSHLAGIDPVNLSKSVKDGMLISLSMATHNTKAWEGTKKWAKMFGYTEDEWEETFMAFRKSGKWATIDSHMAVNEFNYNWSRSIPDSILGEGARHLTNIAKSPITWGKRIGFDVGELNNQAITWMFAKRQWEKNNPGKKFNAHKKYIDEINAEARNLSVDMTKTDALKYQTGDLAAMTQFMAIHNKMLMKILPQKFGGDPSFSADTFKKAAAVKGKFMLGLMAMWGTAGLGSHQWYDSWKKENDLDIPPQMDTFLFGGIMELIYSTSLDLAFGVEPGTHRTALADSISPTGGIFNAPYEFGKGLIEGNFLETLAGPSGTQFPNLFKAANFAKTMWAFDDISTSEKFISSVQYAAEEFGMFSDYFKLNMAMAYKENLDKLYMVGKDGRPTAEANAMGEIWTKFFLGTSNRDEFELYNKWLKGSKEYRGMGKKNEGDVEADGKLISKMLYRAWEKSEGDWFKFSDEAYNIMFTVHRGNRLYGLSLWDEIQKHFTLDPKFNTIVERFAKDHMLVNPDDQQESLINYVRNSDYTPEDQKEHIIESIKQIAKTKEISKEYLDNIIEEK